MKHSKMWFGIFVGPILFAFLLVVVIPMILGIYFSFTDWNGINNNANWVGFLNYIEVFSGDEEFLNAFMFTAKFATVSVFLINAIGFSLALFVTKIEKFSGLLRSVFFMPNLIGGLILGFVLSLVQHFCLVIDFDAAQRAKREGHGLEGIKFRCSDRPNILRILSKERILALIGHPVVLVDGGLKPLRVGSNLSRQLLDG